MERQYDIFILSTKRNLHFTFETDKFGLSQLIRTMVFDHKNNMPGIDRAHQMIS